MTRKTGYLADPKHYRRARYRTSRDRITALPKTASILEFAPPVFDQNETGSCTGAATGSAIYTALYAKGTKLSWVPSPLGIYKLGRAIDRDANPDGSIDLLQDDGAQPNQVMRGISEYGIRPMGPLVEGCYYDCNSENVNDEPTLDELEEESLFTILGEYTINSSGTQRIIELCTAIASKKPVCVAIAGGSDKFQQYTGGILPKLNEPLDHYVWLGEYFTDNNGKIVFTGRNSWSENWGEAGDFRINEDAAQELGDLVVMDVHIKET